MKITKTRLRQIIKEELEREGEPEPEVALDKAPLETVPSPDAPSAPSMSATGLPAISSNDYEGMAHAAISAIVQIASEAGIELDVTAGGHAEPPAAEPPAEEPPMQEGDISLAELKKLIKSELLG